MARKSKPEAAPKPAAPNRTRRNKTFTLGERGLEDLAWIQAAVPLPSMSAAIEYAAAALRRAIEKERGARP